MTTTIRNSEVFMPHKILRSKLIVAVFMSVAFLPLIATAETTNDKEVDEPLAETYTENNANGSEDKVNEVTNITLKSQNIVPSNSPKSVTPNAGLVDNTVLESLDASTATVASDNNAANTTSALVKAEQRASSNTVETLVAEPVKTAKKSQSWLNPNYLLAGGLLLLILGGGLLLFRKISGLTADNRELNQKHRMLKNDLISTNNQLKQSNNENKNLKADLKQQLAIRNENKNVNQDTFGAAVPLMDTSQELTLIEDLDASDRKQLSDSITIWFKTNRGNTEVRELVPAEIQHKLEQLSYKIELWVGSDGVDSVELAKNTMRASVISLTKPDRQGFAYCYKKPNSLSTVWTNRAWYQTQRTDRTLIVGTALEIN